MASIKIPYGKEELIANIPDDRLTGVLTRDDYTAPPARPEEETVLAALADPIGTPRLSVMAKGKKNIVVLTSDHTRALPSRVTLPLLLAEIRAGAPDADITILVAGGGHRQIRLEELESKLGPDIYGKEKLVIHDSDDDAGLVTIGTLPSGGVLRVSKLAYEADLLVAEGLIEPHFFAGFSGGRKSVLPGVSSRVTIKSNHYCENIASDKARTAVMDGNPIHNDMLFAARMIRLDFILNVVINADKKVTYAFAGDVDLAHRKGAELVRSQREVKAVESDIVVTGNGGYPLDQNIYQAVKCMTAAEATVKEGGVIIVAANCNDGHGGESFYNTFKTEPDIDRMIAKFMATPAAETIHDQWQSQILARILKRATVIFISTAPEQMVRDIHMIPAKSIDEAIAIADEKLGRKGSILTIPNGASVIVV